MDAAMESAGRLAGVYRLAATLLAVLTIGAGLIFSIGNEVPTGRVTGRIVMKETGLPIADAEVTLEPWTPSTAETQNPDMNGAAPATEEKTDFREYRYAHTDADGRFTISRVPIGEYTVDASTQSHSYPATDIESVFEAKTTSVELQLTRSQSEIAVMDHQKTFSASEKPVVPVEGYVDASILTHRLRVHDHVTLYVYRTRLSSVLRDPDGSSALDTINNHPRESYYELPDSVMKPDHSIPAPVLTSKTDVTITEDDAEGFYNQRIPIPVAGPGLYLLRFKHGDSQDAAWILVTDLSLVTKRAPGQILAWTTNLQSGTPITGAAIRHYRYGKAVATGVTGRDGTAELRVAADGNDYDEGVHPLTVAAVGNDEAVVTTEGYFAENDGGYVVHAYTDRPIYRPGDTVSYKAVVRRKRDDGAGYDVPRRVPVQVTIRDANGERLLKVQNATDDHGTFHGTIDLSSEAPSGSYSIDTSIAGESHEDDFTVASYKKPEFSVNVTPAKTRYTLGDTAEMTVQAKYYFGAPVVGAKVHYTVYSSPNWATDESADADDDDFYSEEESQEDFNAHSGYFGADVTEGDAVLGADGKFTVRFPVTLKSPDAESDRRENRRDTSDDSDETAPEDLPQSMTFSLTANVTDSAGREIDADGSVDANAGAFHISVLPDGSLGTPNQPTSVRIEARDYDDKPVPNTEVVLTPIYTRYDADLKATQTVKLPYLHVLTDANGVAVTTFTPTHSGDMKLVAQAKDSAGRAIYDTADFWVSWDDASGLDDSEANDLSIHTDKRRYDAGETARVLLTADRTGETALVTVEGDRVYDHYLVPMTKNSVVMRVPIYASYGPNVTLAACYVRSKKFAQSDTPLRVAMNRQTLKVTVTPDKQKYLPQGRAIYDVAITDTSGHPVSGCPFSLGVVDESIYAIQEDDPKAMMRTFYPWRENRVTTSYSFAEMYLGDSDKSEPKIEARHKFLDTAYWNPDLETDGTGHAKVLVTFPDNLTTWRASVYACSDQTQVGYGLSKVIVTKPFLVRLETPRFLTQGDHSRFLTVVHNDTGIDQQAMVHLQAPGLTLDGGAKQSVSVPAGQDAPVTWPLLASSAGSIPLRVTAWTVGGGTQFTDGIERSIPVKTWGREQITTVAGAVRPSPPTPSPTSLGEGATPASPAPPLPAQRERGPGGEGGVDTRVLTIDQNAVRDATRLTVRVTPSLAGALIGSVNYLVGYPYGCTEQTLSRFVPDVLVHRLARTSGQAYLRGGVSDAELARMVNDGVIRLRNSFQHADTGGWGWWMFDKDDPFMTAYVLYGLSIAKQEGFVIDDDMLTKGRKALAGMLPDMHLADRPFALYALAMAGDTDTAFREAGNANLDKIAPDGLAYLVLIDRMAGRNAAQSRAYLELERRASNDGSLLHWKNPDVYWNGSDRMDTALALRAYVAANPRDYRIPLILRWLMKSRTDDYFGDTRDTAWIVTAFCDYLTANPQSVDASGFVTVSVNGQQVTSLDTAVYAHPDETDTAQDAEAVVRVPVSFLHPGANTLSVTSTGGGDVFYTAALTQTIAAPNGGALPALPAPPQEKGLTITRQYLVVTPGKDDDGDLRLTTSDTGGVFHQADAVRVRLTITAPKDLEYVLVEDPFPSAFEPTERGTADEDYGDSDWSWWFSNVDVKDDHIALFARYLPKGQHVYEYNLRAQTPGSVHVLPATLQGMYAEDIHTESASDDLEVKE